MSVSESVLALRCKGKKVATQGWFGRPPKVARMRLILLRRVRTREYDAGQPVRMTMAERLPRVVEGFNGRVLKKKNKKATSCPTPPMPTRQPRPSLFSCSATTSSARRALKARGSTSSTSRFPPVAARLHSHASPEVFRILEGTLTVQQMTDSGLSETQAQAGDIISIPGNVPHGYSNTGPDAVVFSAIIDKDMATYFEVADIGPQAEVASDEEAERFLVAAGEHGIRILAS